MHRSYSFTSKDGKVAWHTSSKEIKDLFLAWIMISLAFSFVRLPELTFNYIFSPQFIIFMVISAVTVGLAFLLHEMAHKVLAQRYHCWAEFRADLNMLVLGVLISFLGVVFIAPGAVMIFGNITRKQNGIISMAGPLTNIVLAILLLPLLFLNFQSTILKEIVLSGYMINAWLALFNMIPLWNFDGAKIYAWDKKVFFAMIIISALLVFLYFVKI